MVEFLGYGQWWENCWDRDECTIVRLTGGGYGVLDHSVQTLVATGETAHDCAQWLGREIGEDDAG